MEPLVLVSRIPCIPEVVVPEVVYLSMPRILWMSSFSSCFVDEAKSSWSVALLGYRRWWRDVWVICRRGVCAKLGSSVFDNVLRLLFFLLFPSMNHFCSNEPCTVVFQVITLSSLSFFMFLKLIQVVFPSLGWSFCFSLSSCRYDKSRIPLGGFSGPSVWNFVWQFKGLVAISVSSVFQHYL